MFVSKEKGFMFFDRELPPDAPVEDRIKHYDEFSGQFSQDKMRQQAYRCMNCGVPFCMSGCPLGNIIPDFNDLVKEERWRQAIDTLHSTNNFPEFTGRVCPAPCEASCCLGVTDPPVSIKLIERAIIDRAWKEGWVRPQPPEQETEKSVAVIGSGPAGLAAAQQLRRAGHKVVVYERDDEPGGLLAYGIPNFKLNKHLVQRRVTQMEQEGVQFRCSTAVGKDVDPNALAEEHDAVLLTIGSTRPRDLPIPGRELNGVHFAMQFLTQQNRRVAGKPVEGDITATGKHVVVLGGGDTGSDCIGTSIRQGAQDVFSIELLPKPPLDVNPDTPWPLWPLVLRTSSSHQEGGERDWSILTKEFIGDADGNVKAIRAVRLRWSAPDAAGRRSFEEIPGSDFEIPADLVLLALGFVHPEEDVPGQLGLERDPRGNVKAAYDGPGAYKTSRDKVFAAGDARRGQSLVVWAIHEGREAARTIDLYLMGTTDLPSATDHGYGVVQIA